MSPAAPTVPAPAVPAAPARAARPDAVALVAIAAGAVLRFTALGRQSYWFDEIHSVDGALGWHGSLMNTVLNTHGALYMLTLRAWMAGFGQGEAATRALSALLGVVGLVMFHRVAARLLGPVVARVGTVLLALSPYHLWYSQETRSYALLFDVGLIAVPAFLADLERRSRASFLGALAATVVACLANLSGFFLLGLDLLFALTVGRRTRYPLARLGLLTALTTLLLSPWLIEAASLTGQLHLGRPPEGGPVVAVKGESPPGLLSLPFTYADFSIGRTIGPSIDELKRERFAALKPDLGYLLPAGALFALVALLGARRAGRAANAVLLPWAVVPVLLMAAVSEVNLKAPNSRYAIFAFAPYLMLLANGACAIRRPALRALALAGMLGFMAWSDLQFFVNPRYWNPDVRAAGAVLTREARPDDLVLTYALDYPVSHYVPATMALVVPPDSAFRDEGAAGRWLDAHLAGRRRVWLVQCQGWWVDREDHFLAACRRRFADERSWAFTNLPTYRFAVPPAEAAR